MYSKYQIWDRVCSSDRKSISIFIYCHQKKNNIKKVLVQNFFPSESAAKGWESTRILLSTSLSISIFKLLNKIQPVSRLNIIESAQRKVNCQL